VPGAGYYKRFKKAGYDYFDARGYFTFGVTPYIDVQFGYDKISSAMAIAVDPFRLFQQCVISKAADAHLEVQLPELYLWN
jgi:hypothetical protein